MATVCTNCGFNNPPGMRFCGNCGTRLPESAPPPGDMPTSETAPGAAAAPVAPENLGVMTGSDLLERFKKAGLEASGQRRRVTVLFVDLSSYTHLSEELGDEELYELVQKFIRLLVNDVYKYEGMVDKLTGDGLMALFGAPIAHENNAERALRSALDMQADVTRLSQELDLHGHELHIHVGLNSGSVIVGGLGGDGLMNYTAIGDSVNLARRLEEAASAGAILVSESVYRQTSRLFDFDTLSALNLKNVSREVTAYRVIGPKARPGSVRGLEGLRAPMIGRENEFRQVQAMVDRLVNHRQGGVVLLVGEGGMGKSRLTSELKASLDYSEVRVLEGHSLTYRKAIAYWIFQDILRSYLGVMPATPDEEVRRRLREVARGVLGDKAGEKLPYLEHLLLPESADMEPADPTAVNPLRYLDAGQLQQQIFLAVRDLLLGEAEQRPVLLILEDLHWADDASLDLVKFLLESTRAAPLTIYAITRPFEGGAVQMIQERASQRLADRFLYIRLQALPPDQSAELLQALLTIQDLPESLRALIIERSSGLPFYLEEILRMLIEDHVIYREGSQNSWRLSPGANMAAVGMPETLQGLILTRFDRLTPPQRRALQTASVVGYQFNRQVLFKILCDSQAAETRPDHMPMHLEESELVQALALLEEREFITRAAGDLEGQDARLGQGGGDLEEGYVFKHVLVSDAIYSTLLQRDRKDLHTRAGLAVEQIYAGRLEPHIELLAGHFLRGALLDRALHYLTLAGKKAQSSYANEQARQHFSQALEVLPKVEHTAMQAVDVYLGLGDVLLTAGDYPNARDAFEHGLDAMGARVGTGTLRTPVEFDPAQWAARRRLLSQLQRKIGLTHEGLGDYDKGLVCLNAAQTILGGAAGDAPADEFNGERASILSDIGWIHFRRGYLDQAEVVLKQALKLSEQAGQLDIIASVLNRLAGIYFQKDVLDEAARYLTRSLALREQIGDVLAVARSYNNLGLLEWRQGDLVTALDYLNHSYQMHSRLGDVEGQVSMRINMGLIELDRGNLDEARQHFHIALEMAGQISHFYHICMVRMGLALLNTFAGSWRNVLEQAQLGLVGFQELGVQENQLDLYVMQGWAYRGLGDAEHLEEVIQHIDALLVQERERGDKPSEGQGRAQRLFGSLAQDQGDLAKARAAFEFSATIFAQVGNTIERSRTLVDLARVLAACDECEAARKALLEARQAFELMGARLDLERLQQVAETISD